MRTRSRSCRCSRGCRSPSSSACSRPSGGRRIVLATNVAETSLTVPGIRYVIDAGLARVKRYSLRNKTTLLQIEKISQAAANQRAGRCGRVADGICVRLYGEDDFAARPHYTDPEILRIVARVGDPADGGARPRRRSSVSRSSSRRARARSPTATSCCRSSTPSTANAALTPLGRELARLPLDPRIGRIVLAARDARLPRRGAGDRERAGGARSARASARARAGGRPGASASSATSAPISCRWSRCGSSSPTRSRRSCRTAGWSTRCRAQFVSFLRLREWRDVHAQLARRWRRRAGVAAALPKAIDAARYATIAQGACSPDCSATSAPRRRTDEHYLGARGIKFYLHPGSGLAQEGRRKWVLAAELTETSRLFARCAAKIEPEWIEEVAGDRVTRDYFEPHWDEKRGEVVASERVQLYGLTLVARRPVSFGAIDPRGGARRVHPRGAGARRARARAARSSRTTGASSPRSPSSSTRRAGRTCWSTTRRSRRSTPSACRRQSIRWRRSSAGARDAESDDPRCCS